MRLAVVVASVLVALAAPARAQADLTFRDTPLADALYRLSDATGVEVVFATRLADGIRVTGRFAADDPDRALRLMLRGTTLRAERIRAGQYVLIALPPTVVDPDAADPKSYTGALEGRVVDAETGEPLPAAHVWLVDVGLGDVVDPGGSFLVPDLPAGRYTVRVSHVGYRPVRVEMDVYPDSPLRPPTVRLAPEPIAAASVDVEAGPEDAGPSPGTSALDAVGAAAVPVTFGEGDLAASLSWLPGLSRTGGSSGPLVVRGADPYQTRALRDGVPVPEPWHAFGLVSAWQPEAIARARLHRGVMPAALGGGVAGVIEVETTDALTGDSLATVAASPIASRALADVRVARGVGLHVGVRHSTLGVGFRPRLASDGGADGVLVLDAVGSRGGPRADVDFADADARLSLRVGPRVRLDGGGFVTRTAVRATAPAVPDGRPPVDARWDGGALSARARALVGERTFVTAIAFGARHVSDESGLGGPAARQTLTEAGASVDADHFQSIEHQIRGGAAVTVRTVTGTVGEASARHTETAVYAMDTWTPAPAWQVQAGLRLEAVADRLLWLPRLAARATPAEDRLTLRAGVGRHAQSLHRLRVLAGDRYVLAAMRWLPASRTVAPSTAWIGGAGAEWAVAPRLAVSADVYARAARDLRDGPTPGAVGAAPGVDPRALAARLPPVEGRAAGVEVAARVDGRRWVFGVTGTAARAFVRESAAGPWRAAAYDRPLAAGVLAERRGAPLSLAVRLDAESGRVRADGRRAPAEVRVGVAAGWQRRLAGVDWLLRAEVIGRPLGDGDPVAVAGADGMPLAVDPTGLPAWPVVSLTGRW